MARKHLLLTGEPGPGAVAEVIPELSDAVPWRYVVTGAVGIPVEEKVLRGADWLAGHRAPFRHLALTRRREGLSRAEFQERWKNHAGRAGGVLIPDEARGAAYVQNHPLPGDWPYDAITEVHLPTRAALEMRVAWFEAHRKHLADDLFQEPVLISAEIVGGRV